MLISFNHISLVLVSLCLFLILSLTSLVVLSVQTHVVWNYVFFRALYDGHYPSTVDYVTSAILVHQTPRPILFEQIYLCKATKLRIYFLDW